MPASGFLFDSNVWIALSFQAHPLRAAAEIALQVATPTEPAFFCRATQQSFLRLLTTESVARQYKVATPTNHQALEAFEGYATAPNVAFLAEPAGVLARWKTFADLPTSSPKRWMDAYLAAVAIEADVTLVTADQDFLVFPGLRLKLIGAATTNPGP